MGKKCEMRKKKNINKHLIANELNEVKRVTEDSVKSPIGKHL